MSLYTLLANDTARSGLRLDLVEPQYIPDQVDSVPIHPFMWTDSCPRPEFDCIPADLEQNLIDAAVEAARVVQAVQGGTMSMILPSHEKYLRLLVQSQKRIDTYKGRYDFADALTEQLSRYRTEVLFNMGIAMFHESLAHGWMDARYSKSVDKLAETAAFFDVILTAPYRTTSTRPELGPDNIRCMALLALGTAKEIEVAYLLKDAANVLDKVADAAFKACHFFRLLTTVAERTSSLPDFTSLLNFANIKRCYYEGLTYLLMSSDPDTTKGKGRRRHAHESFEFAYGYANLHMPGERRQVETEIQTLIEQTINYRTLVRKNMIPFAQISSRKKRFFLADDQFSNTEKKAKLSYDLSQRLQDIGELTEERAKNITGKSTQLTDAQKHRIALEESIGAAIKETTPEHEFDSLVDIVLRTDHVNLLQRVAAVDAQKAEQKAEKAEAQAGNNPQARQTIAEAAKSGDKMAAALAPFYYVQSLVKVQCDPEPVGLHKVHNVAFVFVVDVTGIERPSATSVRELISLAVRFSLISATDKIAVVVPLDGEDKYQIELLSGDEGGKTAFHDKLAQASKLRTASCQPTLVGAVAAARTTLDTLPRAFYKHIFVISDYGMRTMSSYAGNWDMFNKLRAPGDILGPVNDAQLSTGNDKTAAEVVRVHSYAIAGDATGHLLRLMSENTRGDHGYWLKTNDLAKDNGNFAQLRAWLVNILTMTKRTFARDVVVQVTNVGDSRVYDVAAGHSKPVNHLDPKPQLFKDKCASIPDLAHSFGGEVHVVCAIPPEACRQDVVHLGFAELRYTRSDGSVRKVKMLLLNESNVSLIDRESFKWMHQLRLEGSEGEVFTRYEGGSHRQLKCRGVETLVARDTVVCKAGNVSLSSIEGATVEVGPVAEFTVDYVGTNEFVLNVAHGDYKIKTSSFGTCILNVLDEYKIVIPENAMCRVDFSELPEGWTLSVKSIIGTVTIHTLFAAPESGAFDLRASASASANGDQVSAPQVPPILDLAAPRVTMCRLGETPMQPWVGSEDGLLGWKPLAHRVAERVLALADIDMYHCRAACLPVMQDVVRWMQRRNRTGTIQPSNAARRCRKFLIWNRITNVRQQLANSSSQAIGGAEFANIKTQLDVASQFSSPLRYDQISWEVVRSVSDAYRALEQLRPTGSSSAFAPRDFGEQIAVLMSAREREAAERERLLREREREVKNAEVRRRKEFIAALFPLWDFEGDNEVSAADAQTCFYDLPCRETPVVVRVFERWDRLIAATTTKRAFSVEQLVTVLHAFTQDVDAVDFNKFFEQVGTAVKNIATIVDQSRVHRALFALFRWFDHDDNKGWVTMRRIASVIHTVLGDDAVIFRRIEDVTRAAIDVLNTKLPKNFPPPPPARSPGGSRNISRPSTATPSFPQQQPTPTGQHNDHMLSAGSATGSSAQKEAEPVTLETLDAQRITLSTFVQAMTAFFVDQDEPTTHREIERLFNHLFLKAKLPMDAKYVIESEHKREERDRLMDWDLPHVFDGVRDKDLAKVLDPSWAPPANVNDICRAPCLILGLTKIKFNQVHKEDVKHVAEEYWTTTRKLIRTDSDGVFRYLKNFPPLSLSNRQIKVLSSSLESKDFDSTQLSKISPLFSALCSWTRIILRIGWLVHEWEKPKCITDGELSKTMTMQLELQQIQQARAAAEAAGVYRHNSVQEAAALLNGEFQKVYNTAENGSSYAPVPKNGKNEFSENPNALKQPGAAAAVMTPVKPAGGPSNQAPRRTSTSSEL